MPNINYSFNIASNYIFDVLDIEVVDGLAKLLKSNGLYPITNPRIIPITSVLQSDISFFLSTIVASGSDAIQFTLKINAQEKYWSGSAWVDSDGTYAQSNSLAIIQANLATFNFIGSLVPVIFLHSDDGSTTPTIDDITITFDSVPITVKLCNVVGYVYDEKGDPIAGASIVVIPNSYGLSDNKLVHTTSFTVTTDASGFWEILLMETETSKNDWSYKFSINGNVLNKYVPNLVYAEFNDLVDALIP